MVILDARPFGEFARMSIPGAVSCPGGELVRRVWEAAPDPATLVVVNCAGRTRSIIAAQSLVDAGVPNEVAACENGTMGWHLAGLRVARGAEGVAPAAGPATLPRAQAAAAAVAARHGVEVHRGPFDALRALLRLPPDGAHLLDVRSREEFDAGHLPGSRHAAGGQLVQATDEYVGALGARIVCVDDDGVRATMAASWLSRMGWRGVAYTAPAADLRNTAAPESQALPLPYAPAVSPRVLALWRRHAADVAVVDVGLSSLYKKQHVPGAVWVGRAELIKHKLQKSEAVVLTSPDGRAAVRAAGELCARGTACFALHGGTAAWAAAGHAVAAGGVMLVPPRDVAYRPYEDPGASEAAMQAYFDWEFALCSKVRRDGDAPWLDAAGAG